MLNIKNCRSCGQSFQPNVRNKWFCCVECEKSTRYKRRRSKYIENSEVLEKVRKERRNYMRKKRGIAINLPPLKNSPGQGSITKDGYKLITKKGHPNSRKDGTVFEHVFVMSENLGRPLKKNESVHHKNGVRNDNRMENLELWNKGQPAGQRVKDKIEWCLEFLRDYGELNWKPNQFID